MTSYTRGFKPLIDFLIGLVGTVVLFVPAYLIMSVIYFFTGEAKNMLFSQERIGKDGKPFKILKFRSMVLNAEEVLKADETLYQEYIQNSYKLLPEKDPRMTSVGAFIRKTSIDELPQFINILKGDMSLIGPRPILEEELNEYTAEQRKELLSVKPGLTGWWQVSGRSNVFYPERCELELYYPRNISFLLDVKIFFLTVVHVLFRRGAH